MSNTQIIQRAEAAAGVYLEMRGFKIIERNYRRPRCEIDIIAQKNSIVYFVEVNYRRSDSQDGELESTSPSKLRQMVYAAELWIQETKWSGMHQMATIDLIGSDYSVIGFIDNNHA